jgi:hypothetical protein
MLERSLNLKFESGETGVSIKEGERLILSECREIFSDALLKLCVKASNFVIKIWKILKIIKCPLKTINNYILLKKTEH